MNTARTASSEVFITCLLAATAFILYSNTNLYDDVAWHVIAAQRLLAGGTYTTNLFDTNAPFVFMFFIPIVLLQKLLPLSTNLVYLYLLVWCLLILWICHLVIAKIYLEDNIFYKRLIYYTTTFCVLFLPILTFGQREIILLQLFLPYFFLTRLSFKQPIPFTLISLISGFLGAFAIYQNLFYIIVPALLDGYKYLKLRRIDSYQYSFYFFFAINLMFLLWLYPEYIFTIIPMVLCFESASNNSLPRLLSDGVVVVSWIGLFLTAINIKTFRQSTSIILTFIATIACFIIYFIEGKVWFYHYYPSLSFTLLLLAFIIQFILKAKAKSGSSLQEHLILLVVITLLTFVITMVGAFFYKDISNHYNKKLAVNQWTAYSKNVFANKKVMTFIYQIYFTYALPFQAQIQVVTPWSNPWTLPYFLMGNKECIIGNNTTAITLLHQLVETTLKKENPDFVVMQLTINKLNYEGRQFSYYRFFFNNEKTRPLLSDYEFFDIKLNFLIYKKKTIASKDSNG